MAGATVTLSPVWIPIGSKFSIEQMMMRFPLPSRSNSNSYSFQPMMLCSTKTSWTGEAMRPCWRALSNSSAVLTKPPPVPPKVNEGRITNGNPISCAISLPSRKDLAVRPLQTPAPSSSILRRNFSRSSVVSMALISTPMIWTPYFFQIPALSQSMAKFNAV